MFGRERLRQENREVVAQKWNAFVNEDKALTVINCGTHGSSINAGKIGLTLLRSAGYSAADGNFERTLREVKAYGENGAGRADFPVPDRGRKTRRAHGRS